MSLVVNQTLNPKKDHALYFFIFLSFKIKLIHMNKGVSHKYGTLVWMSYTFPFLSRVKVLAPRLWYKSQMPHRGCVEKSPFLSAWWSLNIQVVYPNQLKTRSRALHPSQHWSWLKNNNDFVQISFVTTWILQTRVKQCIFHWLISSG